MAGRAAHCFTLMFLFAGLQLCHAYGPTTNRLNLLLDGRPNEQTPGHEQTAIRADDQTPAGRTNVPPASQANGTSATNSFSFSDWLTLQFSVSPALMTLLGIGLTVFAFKWGQAKDVEKMKVELSAAQEALKEAKTTINNLNAKLEGIDLKQMQTKLEGIDLKQMQTKLEGIDLKQMQTKINSQDIELAKMKVALEKSEKTQERLMDMHVNQMKATLEKSEKMQERLMDMHVNQMRDRLDKVEKRMDGQKIQLAHINQRTSTLAQQQQSASAAGGGVGALPMDPR